MMTCRGVPPPSELMLREGARWVSAQKSLGADGWQVSHLRRCPEALLAALAAFLRLVEPAPIFASEPT